ncbi:hypothetical protein F5Y08DRAFT_138049 [Xylaria arbuscula]|nr:hypothetical protein F5Y08DRAFT_138049 [Xylaria arbuscula]
MSPTRQSPSVKETQPAKKAASKKAATSRIYKSQKHPNAVPKRGQPTSAARLVASPYIKFGWHKPLTGETKDVITRVAPIADSMYMLQIDQTRPIETMSLRNGLYWEHRQLLDLSVLSTPGIDHLELFPIDNDEFLDTLARMGNRPTSCEGWISIHYFFNAIRSREFLVLPVQIDEVWITIIARFQRKANADVNKTSSSKSFADMEITDLAIVDPLVDGREERRTLVHSRFERLLIEGLIESSLNIKIRDFAVPNIGVNSSSQSCIFQTGLIAYAISREFIRRLKVLQYRQQSGSGNVCKEFLWAPFEEDYNFSNYRQNLLAACAHQCVEGSGFKTRVALEVPSADSNYDRSLLGGNDTDILRNDEKWNVFQTETHTHVVGIGGANTLGESTCNKTVAPVADMGDYTSRLIIGKPMSPSSVTPDATDYEAKLIKGIPMPPPTCKLSGLADTQPVVRAPSPTIGSACTKSESLKRSLDDVDDDYDDEEGVEVPSPKRTKIESVADDNE